MMVISDVAIIERFTFLTLSTDYRLSNFAHSSVVVIAVVYAIVVVAVVNITDALGIDNLLLMILLQLLFTFLNINDDVVVVVCLFVCLFVCLCLLLLLLLLLL